MSKPTTTPLTPTEWLHRALTHHSAGTTAGTHYPAHRLMLAVDGYNRVLEAGDPRQRVQAARGLAALALRDRDALVAQRYLDMAITIELTGRSVTQPVIKLEF